MAGGEIFGLVTLAIGIASFVFLIRVRNFTKEDPFDKTLTPSERQSFFLNITNYDMMGKQCKCGDDIVNDFCTEEQILSGCVNISPNMLSSKKKFLSYVMDTSKCTKYKNSFLEKENPNEVFDIKANKIHNMATGIMVMYIAFFCILGLAILAPICVWLIVILLIPIICVALFGGLVNIILFIIFCVNFNKGATRDYIKFLDCNGVNKIKFQETFGDIEQFKKNYTTFVVLNSIYIVFNFICNCITAANNKEKDES